MEVRGLVNRNKLLEALGEDELMIDLRLNSLDSIDLRGLPIICKDKDRRPTEVKWVRPEFIPDDGGVVVDGKKYTGGIIFLDEINTAAPSVQNPALQLVLDRKVGSHHLGKNWYICAAGNKQDDKAHVYPLSLLLCVNGLRFTITNQTIILGLIGL